MKIERAKNAARNTFAGLMLRIYQIIVPFLMRTIMIHTLGVEYLGLSSLFTSLLQVLNLAELGVGSAMVYSMYKPIAEDDTEKICALMRLYRLYYRIIGLAVAVIGCLLIPFLPALIKDTVPSETNLYVLYILNLGSTVLSYWLFAYRNCLFDAYQRTDVVSVISAFVSTLQYIFQIVSLIILKNYYVYLIISVLTQALNNLLVAYASKKYFPQYKPVGKLERSAVTEINGEIKDLFYMKFGQVVLNSADSIVVSAFLGLTVLAIYQNYFYILNSIQRFISIFLTACLAGIGNSLVTETKEKNYNDLKKLTFIIGLITNFCTCSLLCLYQPFMKIWMGEELTLDFPSVICLCAYFYIYIINSLLTTFKNAAGLWHQDRYRMIISALANLVMNLIMVQFWGIYGVLLSTVISLLLIGIPWLLRNLFTYLFDRKFLKEYMMKLLSYSVTTLVCCLITIGISTIFDFGNIVNLILRGILCCLIPNVIFVAVYKSREEFTESVKLIDRILHGKLHLTRFIKQ